MSVSRDLDSLPLRRNNLRTLYATCIARVSVLKHPLDDHPSTKSMSQAAWQVERSSLPRGSYPCTLEHLPSRCLPLLAGVNIVNGADYSGICKRRFYSALMSCVFCEINGDNKECHECLCPWGNGGVYKVLPIYFK